MAAAEARVEKYLHQQVTKAGGITRKWESRSHSGVPDRIVIHSGRVWFVEIKTLVGKLTVYQEREHNRLRKHGAEVVTVYGTEGVDEFIKENIDPWARRSR